MEVRDLTVRFAAFAEEATRAGTAHIERLWREAVEEPHADVYGALYTRGCTRRSLLQALPALLRVAPRLSLRAERAVAALDALQDDAAELIQPGPVRLFAVVLVADGSEPAWLAPLGGRLTLFFAAEALPDDRLLLRGLVAHELVRLLHLARALRHLNRGPDPAPDPDEQPLGLHALGYGLACEALAALVPGLPEAERFWFGRSPDPAEWMGRCRAEEARLARALLPDLGRRADPRGQAWRYWLGDGGDPPRAGRYLAWRAVGRLRRGEGADLPALVALAPAAALAAMARACGGLSGADRP